MNNWLNRTEYLIGENNVSKLAQAHVAVFGCGGVGSYVIEALARSGIGSLTLIDKDIVDITNINRQLIADTSTVGKPKVEVEKERLLKINPNLKITTYQIFYDSSHADEILGTQFDYVVDAIDCVTSKINLVEECNKRNIPIICSMGTGNKLDPTKFEIADISKTSICPLAKVMRKELGKRGIKHLKVVYSKEEPKRFDVDNKRAPASISFVPSVAGLILASEVVKNLIS